MNGSVVYRSSSSPWLLTTDYCEQCNDLEFCALVEHELYHIAQATDDYGAPKFNKRPESRCSNFAAMTSRNTLELSGVTAPAKSAGNGGCGEQAGGGCSYRCYQSVRDVHVETGLITGLYWTDGETWLH